MTTLGYIGEKLDLLVKQGSTLGPFKVTLLNADQTPVNLTGCTIRGHVRKKALSSESSAARCRRGWRQDVHDHTDRGSYALELPLHAGQHAC